MAVSSAALSQQFTTQYRIEHTRAYTIETDPPELLRTSRELMVTLDKHSAKINLSRTEDFVGNYNDYITRDDLKNYLVSSSDSLSLQDRADLTIVLRDFERISRREGKEEPGITYRDMALFVVENQGNDRLVIISRENNRLKLSNAKLTNQINSFPHPQ